MSPRRVLIIAHRGASAYAPESTQAAIQTAVRLQADMIELDVQLTRDHRLVIFHDERLERTTNGTGELIRQRYAALARLDAGAWRSPRFAGERILLVSQALKLIPRRCRVNLELKRTTHPQLLLRQLARCLRWTRSLQQVLLSSFHPSLLALSKRAQPRVATALLCRRHPYQALQQALRLGCVALHPHASLVTPALVQQTHAAGLRLHAWTIHRLQEARRLIRFGVDGLVTNRPDLLGSAS